MLSLSILIGNMLSFSILIGGTSPVQTKTMDFSGHVFNGFKVYVTFYMLPFGYTS